MKLKLTALALLLMGNIAFAAEPLPEVNEKKVDIMVEDIIASGEVPPDIDKSKLRQDVKKSMQVAEIFKQEGKKIKEATTDPVKKLQLEMIDDQLQAQAYQLYLMQTTTVSDKELYDFFKKLSHEFKVQIAVFDTEKEAKESLELLRKGLVMTDLIKSLKNKGVNVDKNNPEPEFARLDQMPEPVADVVTELQKGQISDKIVNLDGKYALVKVQDLEISPDFAHDNFEKVKGRMRHAYIQQKVGERMKELFTRYGLDERGQ